MNTTTTKTTITGMHLSAFFTNDVPRSIAFYRDVLGLVPTEIDEEGRGSEFTLADGTTFGIWKGPDTKAPGATVFFAVDDINQAVNAFRQRGAQLADPMETPACFMAFGVDPDGNGFAIHQRKG